MTTLHDLIKSGKISLETEVLGELPMTADGCIICIGAPLFPSWGETVEDNTFRGFPVLSIGRGEHALKRNRKHWVTIYGAGLLTTDDLYSSRAAALAARSKQ